VSYVFPLDAIPEWIGGRIFYQFLSQAIRWLLTPLVIALAVIAALASRTDEGTLALRRFLVGVAFDLALLVVAFALLFFISRRVAAQVVSIMARTTFGQDVAAKRYPADDEIRNRLETDRSPPMGANIVGGEIAVWISGHTHAPAISELVRPDGRTTVIANTGCWLRQLQPVDARLGAPTVFVPAFVHTQIRVRPTQGSLTVELWDHPKPVDRRFRWIDPLRIVPKDPDRVDRRLQWIERVAIIGRMPGQPPLQAAPRLVSRYVVARGSRPAEEASPGEIPSGR
jgi:hypothetical protein